MQAREGELIETKDGIIFDVKGLVHPPNKIISFPRFIPSIKGNRKRKESKYTKIYNLKERFKFLKNNVPDLITYDSVFDETLCEVPIKNIKRHYNPINKLEKLRKSKKTSNLQKKAVELLTILKEKAKIPWRSIGISGSVLVELSNIKSDLDPVIYGIKNCRKTYKILEKILKNGETNLKAYDHEGLKNLFDFRSKDTYMNFDDFLKVESRKAFQGTFLETDFFIRFVKDWNQIIQRYGDIQYKNCGEVKISATIADDSEALFTPCTYKIENVKVINGAENTPIYEIVSFRGRFCQQAKKEERIIAQGKIEQVKNKRKKSQYYRLILGAKPTDYMILA
jgi:predicted nucleotidyltransferase